MAKNVESMIANVFMDMAQMLETGESGRRPKMAVTAMGTEHGEGNVLEAALIAQTKGVDVTLIGTIDDDRVNIVKVADEDEAHKKMDELVESGAVDGAVTMHYPFPIGVSTIGRVVTPGLGKPMYIAATTGTSATERVKAMILNTVYGIITAKACGIAHPTVGIANIDGARQAEIALKKLKENGYEINFASSERADGGAVMRGNDILTGAADIMVMDALTGNLMIKMLSAFNSGGKYESIGWGYGPGIGEGYDKLILIASRASGAAVIAGALEFGGQMVKGNYRDVAKAEFAAAKKAGLEAILAERDAAAAPKAAAAEEVKAPPKEVVTAVLSGVEVMDLEDAVTALWAEGIYAESGMGCTGPVILVSEANHEKGGKVLIAKGYLSE